MSAISVSSFPASFIVLLNRLSLGLYLAMNGYAKVFDMGVTNFYEQRFLKLKPNWLPTFIAMPYGYAIPWLELIVGVMLAIGLLGRLAAGLTCLMILSFTIALIHASGSLKTGQEPFTPNLLYISMAALLFLTGPGKLSADAIITSFKKGSSK